jgi:hypothetical protein
MLMIRLGNRIRLTKAEVERFTEITGFEPVDVKTLDNFAGYVKKCKEYYWGTSSDTQFLHYLIDKEASGCLRSVA